MQKGKLIIVEGIDSTGKSSLVAAIAFHRKPTPVVFHCTASPMLFQGLHDYHMNVADFIKKNLDNGHDVVLDRFWPSEIAYGRVFRSNADYPRLVPRLLKEIEHLDITYVHCDSPNAAKRYFAEKKHDPAHSLTQREFEVIRENYMGIFDSMPNPKKVVPYELEKDGTYDELPRFIGKLFGEEPAQPKEDKSEAAV